MSTTLSPALERLKQAPPEKVRAMLASLSDEAALALLYDWPFWARANQLPPEGAWLTWLLLAGRGFGKTRSGAGWVHRRAMNGDERRWIALVSKTPGDARDDMIEGPGGLLKSTPPWERPTYEPSKRRLTWPSGAYATIYSGANPEQLRGFSGDTAWLDEFAAYQYPTATWDNLIFGMREKRLDDPAICITTTPKPIRKLKEIAGAASTAVVRGSSWENRANLADVYFSSVIEPLQGTTLGRQEIEAELFDEAPGALWSRRLIEDNRVSEAPELVRALVAVDPAVSANEHSNETGVIVAGRGIDGHAYITHDLSAVLSPGAWGGRVVNAYRDRELDVVVAEVNNGGDLVESNVRSIDPDVSYKAVRASRGKRTRAEPVASLYERGKVHHVGRFDQLEDQLCSYDPDTYEDSPDRLDAMVWAVTELMLQPAGVKPRVRSVGL